MPQVTCAVASCFFWDVGDLCQADRIHVRPNAGTGRLEAGAFVVPGERTPAALDPQVSWETCCETFRPRAEDRPRGDPTARAGPRYNP